MLKKVYFEGMILVDLQNAEKKSTWDYEYYIKEAINDYSDAIDIVTADIKKLEDIPKDWKEAIPYGSRKDEKRCINIFNEEILPALPIVDDPNQTKFGFWYPSLDFDIKRKNK